MILHLSHRLVPGRFETAVVAQALLRGALPHLVGPAGVWLGEVNPVQG